MTSFKPIDDSHMHSRTSRKSDVSTSPSAISPGPVPLNMYAPAPNAQPKPPVVPPRTPTTLASEMLGKTLILSEGKKGRGKVSATGHVKPSVSYATLITRALSSAPSGLLTLNEIYEYICENHPFYQTAGTGWKVIVF